MWPRPFLFQPLLMNETERSVVEIRSQPHLEESCDKSGTLFLYSPTIHPRFIATVYRRPSTVSRETKEARAP